MIASRFRISDFELSGKLGEGRFGKVYLAREKANGYTVALKTISKDYAY